MSGHAGLRAAEGSAGRRAGAGGSLRRGGARGGASTGSRSGRTKSPSRRAGGSNRSKPASAREAAAEVVIKGTDDSGTRLPPVGGVGKLAAAFAAAQGADVVKPVTPPAATPTSPTSPKSPESAASQPAVVAPPAAYLMPGGGSAPPVKSGVSSIGRGGRKPNGSIGRGKAAPPPSAAVAMKKPPAPSAPSAGTAPSSTGSKPRIDLSDLTDSEDSGDEAAAATAAKKEPQSSLKAPTRPARGQLSFTKPPPGTDITKPEQSLYNSGSGPGSSLIKAPDQIKIGGSSSGRRAGKDKNKKEKLPDAPTGTSWKVDVDWKGDEDGPSGKELRREMRERYRAEKAAGGSGGSRRKKAAPHVGRLKDKPSAEQKWLQQATTVREVDPVLDPRRQGRESMASHGDMGDLL